MTLASVSARRTRPTRGAYVLLVAVAGLVLAVDQATKGLARDRLADGDRDLVGPLALRLTSNDGVAFSLFGGGGALIIAVTAVAALAVLAWFVLGAGRRAGGALGAALVLGGALGNLLDRVRLGAVTDFIDVGPWPTFNVADTAIVTGVALLALFGTAASRGT